MKIAFLKIYIFLILTVIPMKAANSEVFIVAKINQEIITNIDVNFEKRYLVSLNPNLKKLDQDRIIEYAKNSLINERIKKIEIEKKFKILPNETLLSKVIGDIYSSIGISSLTEFENYLLQNDVDIQRVKEKISIEIAWNDLIVKTFASEIEIDQNAISKEIEKFDEKKVNNLLLSEIIFTINDKKELELKYEAIKESINEIGFEETARIYSLSDSKKSGGNLGWIYKNQLSKEIKDELNNIKIGDFTKPIITSGGFLILKLNNIKTENIKIDKDTHLKKMIEFEKERQFTRFSTLYYKRIYNNAEINEK
ncbi:MAG: peptidylprolyl isomerase [Candidatus Pelagibacter sp.]|tara:strand:- start:2589 stop:3518 length:930 start_codon:yes stop_codon:yes gene_type:complete